MLYLQYFYNIFKTNHKWLVVIGSNLKLTLRLFFCPNNNNLSLKICCKNIVEYHFSLQLVLLNIFNEGIYGLKLLSQIPTIKFLKREKENDSNQLLQSNKVNNK